MRVALFGNVYREETFCLLRRAVRFFQEHGDVVLCSSQLYAACGERGLQNLIALWNEEPVDFVLSMGGDGTFLTTAAHIGASAPILGVNTGRLGFLADIAPNDMEAALCSVLGGRYVVEERMTLGVTLEGRPFGNRPYALNEVAVLKQDLSSMISVSVLLDGVYLHTYQADGLIMATPTGSTAYALSVGGPILTPDAHSLILAPVATHSLTVRPLVIPDSSVLDLRISSRSGSYLVSLDGVSQVLSHDVSLRVARSSVQVRTLRVEGHSFFDTLKNKLMWGADTRVG